MKAPLVSICLPSLDSAPYLQERIDTILAQTYTNWELIVIDSFSTDGSWEMFNKLAQGDKRVSIEQAPRGLYTCWNQCIERAQGEYVYVATSDDTMAPDCLEKMVAALEEHKDCELAHCALVIIDGEGATIPTPEWRGRSVFGLGLPDLVNRRHKRRAPWDGLLHLTGQMVYQSITELLIRRSLFARIGGFRETWGSVGDMYWDMKAGLVANTVHVPDTWATWRVYDTQRTTSVDFSSLDHSRKIGEMIHEAVLRCEPQLAPEVLNGLKDHWLAWASDMRSYYAGLRNRPAAFQRRLFQASQLKKKTVRTEMFGRLCGGPRWPERAPNEIKNWLESLGPGPVFTFLA